MLYRIIFSIILLSTFSCQTRKKVSFEEIQNIINANCTSCHNPLGGAPFSLETFKDIKSKASTIQDVLENGIMPPWPADPNYRSFIGEKTIDNAQRKKIIDWIKQGAPGPVGEEELITTKLLKDKKEGDIFEMT